VVLRRSLALFVATAMVEMMAVSRLSSNPGSENNFGASNPEFRKPPSRERALGNCGVENNPLFRDKPESPHFG
jgi:hypothetical protein